MIKRRLSPRAAAAGLLAAALLGGSFCARRPAPAGAPGRSAETGIASWYGPGFHGRTTSNGETYDMYGWTAAHRTLPFGTRLRVTNLSNGRTVDVRVNDRGPFVGERILDLSFAAARRLEMVEPGTTRVRLDILSLPPGGAELVFVVQAGAFAEEANAEVLAARLRADYGGVRIVPAEAAGRTIYRVRLDASGKPEAERTASALAGRGIPALVLEVGAERGRAR